MYGTLKDGKHPCGRQHGCGQSNHTSSTRISVCSLPADELKTVVCRGNLSRQLCSSLGQSCDNDDEKIHSSGLVIASQTVA